nr:sulfurtransferase TusA family protein [Desulfuromonadales bacterium]
MPVIKAAQTIAEMASGETMELIATDRGALSDMPAWAKDTGNSLKEQFEENGEFHFIIEKS